MIVVRVLIDVQPENKNEFVQLMNTDRQDTVQFKGCQHFVLYEDTLKSNSFILYEEWESQEHFEAYTGSDYFKGLGSKLFPLIDGKPNTQYYSATPI